MSVVPVFDGGGLFLRAIQMFRASCVLADQHIGIAHQVVFAQVDSKHLLAYQLKEQPEETDHDSLTTSAYCDSVRCNGIQIQHEYP